MLPCVNQCLLSAAVFCECPTDFKVDATQLEKPLDKALLATEVTTPSGKKLKPTIKDNQDKTYTVGYTPVEQGGCKLHQSTLDDPCVCQTQIVLWCMET